MDDYIDNETPATTASTIARVFCPKEDGVFAIKTKAYAEGNGQGAPFMWINISTDDGSAETMLKKGPHVAWENGPADITLLVLFAAKKGGLYTVHAMSGNENASAKGIEVDIKRVH